MQRSIFGNIFHLYVFTAHQQSTLPTLFIDNALATYKKTHAEAWVFRKHLDAGEMANPDWISRA
ncbi:hypothetical protein SAMN04487951_108158 [Vreelandella arcis]|uniref:Uncharacterized protein n=1 Tax=Vreelandella arcis TaxID=416873 RepID=A0A1H0EI43_9GAMM|nr:hypothetical protein SAMN04487951_108158 [Halomonas arcis]